jgi:hypothetical protein
MFSLIRRVVAFLLWFRSNANLNGTDFEETPSSVLTILNKICWKYLCSNYAIYNTVSHEEVNMYPSEM